MRADKALPHNSRLMGLDVVRVLAALMVTLFHLGFWSWAPDHSTPRSVLNNQTSYPELTGFAWWGWVGVEIFFVVSGFVIAYSAAAASPAAFVRARMRRLVPAAWICATITLVVAAAIQWKTGASLIISYAKTISFWPISGWIDGVYWTLGIEIAFYGIVFLVLCARRFSWIEPVMAAVTVVSSSAWILHFVCVSQVGVPAVFGIQPRLLQLALIHHGMYFAAGVFLWAGMYRGWTSMRVGILVIALAGGVLPILAEANAKSATFSLGAVQLLPVCVWLLGVLAIWTSVKLDGMLADRLRRWASLVRMLGLATYPVYLLHDVVGAALLRALVIVGFHPYVALFAAVVAILLLAVAVTASVERWLRDLLFGWWRVPAV